MGFLKGCPFTCPWCCNPENLSFEPEIAWHEKRCVGCSVRINGQRDANGCPCDIDPSKCPTGAKELLGKSWEADKFARDLMRDRIFFEESGGGVTLSGGECLAGRNLPFAIEVLSICHREGCNTAVETTLAVPMNEAEIDALLTCVSTFLVDFKIADAVLSRKVLGLDIELQDRNLTTILSRGANVVARMPIIPGYTDSYENVKANLARIIDLGIHRVEVLPFHQLGTAKYDASGHPYTLRGLTQLSADDVAWVAELAHESGMIVGVGGA